MKKPSIKIIAAAAIIAVGSAACGSSQQADVNKAVSADSEDSQLVFSKDEGNAFPGIDKMGTINLPALSEITVTAPPVTEQTDMEVRTYAENEAARNYTNVMRAAKEGDVVNIDYVGKMNGEAFDGGTSAGYDLKLGSNTFIEGFESQLIGSKAGDKLDINVTFPADYHNKDLAGKPAVFSVTINAVQEEGVLDDAYVKANSDTATTVDEYLKEKKEELKRVGEQERFYAIEEKAMDALVEQGTFEPSDELIAYLVQENVNSLMDYLESSGLSIDEYAQQTGMTLEQLSDAIKENAKNTANYEMVVRKIQEDAGIELNDESEKAFLELAKTVYGSDSTKEQLISDNGQEWYDETVVDQAVYRYIADHVTVIDEEPVKEEEADAQPEQNADTETTAEETTAAESETDTAETAEAETGGESESVDTASTDADTANADTDAADVNTGAETGTGSKSPETEKPDGAAGTEAADNTDAAVADNAANIENAAADESAADAPDADTVSQAVNGSGKNGRSTKRITAIETTEAAESTADTETVTDAADAAAESADDVSGALTGAGEVATPNRR